MSGQRSDGVPPRISLLGRSTLLLGLLSLGLKLFAFVREMVLSAQFGATPETDAFYLVWMLLLAVGMEAAAALPKVFIPAIQAESAQHPRAGQQLASVAAVAAVGLLGGVAVFAGVFAEPLMALVAPEFTPEIQALGVHMARVVLPTLPLLGFVGIVDAVARGRGDFLLVGAAPGALTAGLIVFVVGFAAVWGIEAAAWGLLAGTAGRAALCAAYLVRERIVPGWQRRFLKPSIVALGSVAGLVLIGSSGGYAGIVVERYFAALLPAGHLSCMSYAQRLAVVPGSVVTGSLLAVLLPAMTNRLVAGDREDAERLATRAMRVTTFGVLPVVALMGGLAEPSVRIVFGRGAFDEADIHLTSLLLLCYVPMVGVGVIRWTLVATFYAFGRARTVIVLGALRVAAMAALFPFVWQPFGAAGLVLTLGAIEIAACALMVWLSRKGLGLSLAGLEWVTVRVAGVSAVAAGLAWLVAGSVTTAIPGLLGNLAALVAGGGLGGLAVLGLSRLTRLEEADLVLDLVRQRLARLRG